MNRPIVSVLTTSYNREMYIGQALDSVLASTFQEFEIIVSDDGSTDRTVEIARAYEAKDKRIRVYQNEKNLGDYNNRNKAASRASGTYLKYVDSDDQIYEHTLEVMVRYMNRFPEAGFGLCTVHEPSRPFPILIEPAQAYREHFAGDGHFFRAPGSSIIRRSAFEAVGGFSGKRMIGDNELWFTLARYYPLVKLVTGLSWDRIHGQQERYSNYALNYQEMLFNITMEALTHKDCPLPEAERSAIIKQVIAADRRQTVRNRLKKLSRFLRQ